MSAVETIEVANASVEETRELVRVVVIDDILTHPNADSLELAIIGGWQCCVRIGEFKKGDAAVYCEIDAMLPLDLPMFGFLEARKESLKEVDGRVYSRVKTIRLRKELSQGLLIPVGDFTASGMELKVGDNLTASLGILKYEASSDKQADPLELKPTWFQRMCLAIAGGEPPKLQLPWPEYLPKSEQPRVQNVSASYNAAVASGEEFEVSVKLDGASMTAWYQAHMNYSGVASRNNRLIIEDVIWGWFEQFRRWFAALLLSNRRLFKIKRFIVPRWKRGLMASEDQFVKAFFDLKLHEKLKEYWREHALGVAVQGELCGPGINKNFERLSEHRFYVYAVLLKDKDGSIYRPVLPEVARAICDELGLEYVPVISRSSALPPTTKQCLLYAEGKSAFNNDGYREGLVFKSTTRDFSFKVISNSYLLKQGD